MKKFLVNFVFIIIVLVFIEFLCFLITRADNLAFKKYTDKVKANNTELFTTKYRILEDFYPIATGKSFVNDKAVKKPVLWFGCSFAEGAGLNELQTPCYKLSKLTGRSCINRSRGATGTQFMYYQLQNKEFFEKAPEAEYIIYTFIYHHINRLFQHQLNPLLYIFNIRYKLSNGHLEEIKPLYKPLYSSFAVKKFLYMKEQKQAEAEKQNFKLFNKMMMETVNITKEKYPNSKFIMIEFKNLSDKRELPKRELEELNKMGITVVRASDIINDITDKKYWLEDNIHPSELAWDIILPEIAKNYIK